jgi:hypothetical protein
MAAAGHLVFTLNLVSDKITNTASQWDYIRMLFVFFFVAVVHVMHTIMHDKVFKEFGSRVKRFSAPSAPI